MECACEGEGADEYGIVVVRWGDGRGCWHVERASYSVHDRSTGPDATVGQRLS